MRRLGLAAVVMLVTCLALPVRAQSNWDTVGDYALSLLHDAYTDEVTGDDVMASGSAAATALFVPQDIENGGVPTAGMIGYQYYVCPTHGPAPYWNANLETSAYADLWDSVAGTSDYATTGVVSSGALYGYTSAGAYRPSSPMPGLDQAGPNSYSWSEARTDIEAGYDDLPATEKAAVDALLDDMVASAEYAEVKDYLLNGSATAVALAEHVIVEGASSGMIDIVVELAVSGEFSAYATSETGQSGAAAGVFVGGGAANATFEDGWYGAAGMWAHGSGMTEFAAEGGMDAGDFTATSIGYTQDSVYTITLTVPVNDPFVIGFGLVTGSVAGADPNELWVTADGYTMYTAAVTSITVPAGYTVSPVPEPSSLALLAIGLGVVIRRRRK